MVGISIQIIGSQVSYSYYAFYNEIYFRNFYCTIILILGIGNCVMIFWEKINSGKFAALRASMKKKVYDQKTIDDHTFMHIIKVFT